MKADQNPFWIQTINVEKNKNILFSDGVKCRQITQQTAQNEPRSNSPTRPPLIPAYQNLHLQLQRLPDLQIQNQHCDLNTPRSKPSCTNENRKKKRWLYTETNEIWPTNEPAATPTADPPYQRAREHGSQHYRPRLAPPERTYPTKWIYESNGDADLYI